MKFVYLPPGREAGVAFESDARPLDVFQRFAAARVVTVISGVRGGADLWCDEESLLTGATVNETVSRLTGDVILGPVVAAGTDGNGETVDVPEAFASEFVSHTVGDDAALDRWIDATWSCRDCFDQVVLVTAGGMYRCDHPAVRP